MKVGQWRCEGAKVERCLKGMLMTVSHIEAVAAFHGKVIDGLGWGRSRNGI